MKNLIQFPEGNGWQDTGEGGLFAYAVVRENSDNAVAPRERGGCCVDVHNTLNRPDVQVWGPSLWTPLYGNDMRDQRSMQSESLIASVFLGATNQALYSENEGDYFRVSEESLTEDGKAIVRALSLLGQVEYLTFLDT